MKKFGIGLLLAFAVVPAQAQIYRLAEMSAAQIQALDRQKTVILIPGTILEEHGPYLPVYTDGYSGRYFTDQLAAAIAARPGWKAVVLPEIPLGFGGANNIGGKWDYSGSFTVRLATLRAIYMDLAGDLGEQKFHWIMVVHDHGDPAHNKALEEAGDYFHDTYGGTMVHLFGLTEVVSCDDGFGKLLGKQASDEDGFTVHAGAEEHSQILFLKPQLVDPAYRGAPAVTARNFDDLYNLAEHEGWPGYFGAPQRASAILGRQVLEVCSQKLNSVALRILDGFDYRRLPRFYDQLDPRDAIGDKAERDHDRGIETRQRLWLQQHGIE